MKGDVVELNNQLPNLKKHEFITHLNVYIFYEGVVKIDYELCYVQLAVWKLRVWFQLKKDHICNSKNILQK